MEEENGLAFDSQEFYFKSEEEMRALFPDVPEAIDNTGKIAERCQVELEFGKTKLPKFEAPDGEDNRAYFYRLCEEGLHRRYGENPPENVRERLAYEQSVIEKMGYINYYLIVYDFIRYARSVDIPVGPGRGSGAGSLAAYCLGITSVDPIRYHLLFERFLNPERVSMPDFDVDFSDERRPEMIEYVVRKYGSDHVAQDRHLRHHGGPWFPAGCRACHGDSVCRGGFCRQACADGAEHHAGRCSGKNRRTSASAVSPIRRLRGSWRWRKRWRECRAMLPHTLPASSSRISPCAAWFRLPRTAIPS